MTDKPTRRGTDLLAPRRNETPEEAALREKINRSAVSLMATLDEAISMRRAPGAAQRMRHQARGALEEFAMRAMEALHISEGAQPDR